MTQGVLDQSSAGKAGPTSTQHVYFFGGGKAEGNGKMKDDLGGKGAGLAEMTNAGLPVPPSSGWKSCKARSWARETIPCWFLCAPAQSSPCPA
jgi:pyruvate,orthophosphate dikinase